MLYIGYFKGTIDKPLAIPYKFQSSYEQCGGEPKFTIYIKSHQKSIDYIYYNEKILKVHGVLNVSPEEVSERKSVYRPGSESNITFLFRLIRRINSSLAFVFPLTTLRWSVRSNGTPILRPPSRQNLRSKLLLNPSRRKMSQPKSNI